MLTFNKYSQIITEEEIDKNLYPSNDIKHTVLFYRNRIYKINFGAYSMLGRVTQSSMWGNVELTEYFRPSLDQWKHLFNLIKCINLSNGDIYL